MPIKAGLSDKQKLFVEEYLQCLNATEAARKAGYKGGENTLASQGSDNLRNAKIRAYVDARLAESAMKADEVLGRLTEQARGSLDDFLKNGSLDLEQAAQRGKLHMVKKITQKKRSFGEDGIETEIQIELHDSQAALTLLGKHHRLFVDRQELTGKEGGAIEVSDARGRLAQLIDSVASRSAAPEGDSQSDGSGSRDTHL